MGITGGVDKNAVVFNKENEQIVATLKGHTKKVTAVIYHPHEEIAITASADNTVRVWSIPNSSCAYIIKAHEGAVTGLSLHATGDYVLTSSRDQYWAFSDIQTGKIFCKNISDANANHGLTCAQFHPDGLIFGTGTTDSVIKIWDLKNFKTITLDESEEIKALCFDKSGNYLAVAGTNIQLYVAKQWDLLRTLQDHTGIVTSLKFGKNASFLASASMDRNLKYFSR